MSSRFLIAVIALSLGTNAAAQERQAPAPSTASR
jgi:hypothetical protein